MSKRDVKYAFGDSPEELIKERYCLKSYFAFGDHKSSNYDYETMLLRSLRRKWFKVERYAIWLVSGGSDRRYFVLGVNFI